jgi:hypothetical protein
VDKRQAGVALGRIFMAIQTAALASGTKGGGEWSPLLPADFAKGQAPAFPGTVVAPLPTSDGTWRYAASQARKARTQTAAFAAGAIIVLILIVGHVMISKQLPYLGLVLALRAF